MAQYQTYPNTTPIDTDLFALARSPFTAGTSFQTEFSQVRDYCANVLSSELRYVSDNGNDSTGTGSVLNPWKTLAHAYSSITDASSTKPYTIICSGNLVETNISLKSYISVFGNGANLNISSSLSIDSSWSGGIGCIQGFSEASLPSSLTLNFSGYPSSIFIFKDISFISNSLISVLGDTSNECLITIENIKELNSSIQLYLQDCNCYLLNNNIYESVFYATSTSIQFDIYGINNIISNTFQFNTETGAVINAYSIGNKGFADCSCYTTSGGNINLYQQSCFFNSQILDGTNILLNTDSSSVSSAISLSGGATSSSIVYRNISDGLTANYTPVNYTAVNPQVQGHLHGIDNALAGSGMGFLLASNNLSDVDNVATARTNLGLGTMAVQNANAVDITGGTIDGTAIGSTTPSTLKATSITETTFASAGVVHNAAGGLFSSGTVTNSDMANMNVDTFKGNILSSAAPPQDLTIAQMKSSLGITTTTLSPTEIGFGSASSLIIGSSNFTWTDTTLTLALANGSSINLGNSVSSRKIVLYNSFGNNYQYYGFGISGGQLQYTVDESTSDHVFLVGASSSSSNEIMRIKGNETVSIGATSAASGNILDVVSTTLGSRTNPSMTSAQRLAISSPAVNTQVYDTTLGQGMFWNGSAWAIMY